MEYISVQCLVNKSKVKKGRKYLVPKYDWDHAFSWDEEGWNGEYKTYWDVVQVLSFKKYPDKHNPNLKINKAIAHYPKNIFKRIYIRKLPGWF